jgi:4,5-dihydroxyphthalate decarboxylase
MSRNLALTFACGAYDRIIPLITGEVRAEGIDLTFTAMDDPRKIFDIMTSDRAFDVAEMSMSEYISRFVANDCPFVALPVFPSRVFRHSMITINRRSIERPADFTGKRVGVPLYTMTAAIFIRALLEHDYDVDLSGVHWVQGAINDAAGHGNPKVMPLLRAVDIEVNRSGRSLSDLLAAREIDAIIGTSMPDSFATSADVERLFPQFREVEKDYYRRTKIFPIMHVVVIRRELYEQHPFIGQSLYSAFEAAKAEAWKRMQRVGTLAYMLPWMIDDLREIADVFGGDPWPYGIEPNRPTLEALIQYMQEQGIIARIVQPESLFLPVKY